MNWRMPVGRTLSKPGPASIDVAVMLPAGVPRQAIFAAGASVGEATRYWFEG
jgi:hypothetical protein